MPKGYPADGLPRKRPRLCQVCRHGERDRIEMLLAAGLSLDRVAEKFPGLDRHAIWRHWQKHVAEERKAAYLCGPAKLAELTEVAAEEGGSVLDHLRVLRSILMQALSNSAKGGDVYQVTTVAKPLLGCLKQLGEVTGEIARISSNHLTVNVNNFASSPAFLDLEAGLLSLCARHPEVRGEIVVLLHGLDAKYGAAPQMIETHALPEAAE
jgi:hypothetical protein